MSRWNVDRELDEAVARRLVRFLGARNSSSIPIPIPMLQMMMWMRSARVSPAAASVRKRIAGFLARHGTDHPPPPILLRGEVGVGKSLLAQLIHQAGPRPDGPFVAFDCATMPPSFHEAELFGIALTPPRPGLFQRAHGGTLFIDGVGRLAAELLYDPRLQVSWILRALEERSVHRVGSSLDPAEPAAVWIIAATCENLKAAVHEGRFPNDLYRKLGQLMSLVE